LLINDGSALTGTGIIRKVYDPACGTGGMLALTEEAMRAMNPRIRVELFGQELNGESFGICKSDMLVTGHDPEQIAFGNTLTHDAHKGKRFHYMLCNPPYGVDWKKYQDPIKDEAERLGKHGRFGAGLPRISKFSRYHSSPPPTSWCSWRSTVLGCHARIEVMAPVDRERGLNAAITPT
jgi:type I restriction enzyme M protein